MDDFLSMSTLSTPVTNISKLLVMILKKLCNAITMTIIVALAYIGFNKNKPCSAKVIIIPVNKIEK